MAIEPNENEEEDILGAEGEEEDTPTGDEEEAEAESEEEDAGGDGEGDGGDDDGEEDAAFVVPEKFKGKKMEDVAKSYVELEKSLEKKVAAKVREEIAKARPTGKNKPGDDDAIKKAMEGVDFSKMQPEDFAAWLIKTVEGRAQEIARTTYEAADTTKAAVQADINSVTKSWPQLKENEGFRELVLSRIENAANKGEILPLKEACAAVGKAMGLKPGAKKAPADAGGEEEAEPKPRPNTRVERPNGGGGGDKKTDEEAVLEGLLGGGKAPAGLGGLM